MIKFRKNLFASLFLIGIIFSFGSVILSVGVYAQEEVFGSSPGGEFSSGSGSYASSNPQYTSAAFSGGSFGSASYWPGYFGNATDYRENCRERQDFVIQIAPAGCSPAVVRSDLLAEQNVAVFCKLQGMQINPLIDPQNIRTMTFSQAGKTPAGVVGVASYHPPKLALSSYTNKLGFHTLDNLGYVVIILKREPNENKMPEYVSGNLTLRMNYVIPQAMGVGFVDKEIPVLTDAEWASEYPKYAILDGKAYLRVEGVESNRVKVALYADEKRKISSFVVTKGQTARDYLPGGYCSLGYEISYSDAVMPKKKATIVFDNNQEDVYEREWFAGGLCFASVININGSGIGQVSGYCKNIGGSTGDASTGQVSVGNKNFILTLGQKVEKGISVGTGAITKYNVGEEVYSGDPSKVYFGGTGFNSATETEFAVLVEVKPGQTFESLKSQVNDYIQTLSIGSGIASESKLFNDNNEAIPILLNKDAVPFLGANFKFASTQTAAASSSFVDANGDFLGDGEFENYFKSAVDGYVEVDGTYGTYKSPTFENNYGIEALTNAIKLSSEVKKTAKQKELLDLFESKYPDEPLPTNAIPDYNENIDSTGAGAVIKFNEENHFIRLVSLDLPSEERSFVRFETDDGGVYTARTAGELFIKPDTENNLPGVRLDSFDSEGVVVSGNCKGTSGQIASGKVAINLGGSQDFCGRVIKVTQINLEKSAKIKVSPYLSSAGSVVNISYTIGIEQRAIKLTPEKTKERIAKLNETIAKWEKISTNLASVVKGMKAACFVTSAALQVKNLFSNMGGKAIAREQAMGGANGWDKMCAAAMGAEGNPANTEFKDLMAPGLYNSIDDCYGKNAGRIEGDVNALTAEIKKVNDEIKASEGINNCTQPGGGIFAGRTIDGECARDAFNAKLQQDLQDNNRVLSDENRKNNITVSGVFAKKLDIPYDEAREIRLYTNILESDNLSPSLRASTERKLYSLLTDVKKTAAVEAESDSFLQQSITKGQITENLRVSTPQLAKGKTPESYNGAVVEDSTTSFYSKPVQVVLDKNFNPYYAILKPVGDGKYIIENVTEYGEGGSIGALVEDKDIKSELIGQYGEFRKFDGDSYNNQFREKAVVKYYETAPYKGMPALVPIDTTKGWYAATKQTMSASTATNAFQESGGVSSFWLCNVGKNGRVEFDEGVGDDICQMFNLNTGQPINMFNGLSEAEATSLVKKAVQAIQQAANQYKKGVKKVTILGKTYDVGNPAVGNPGTQCQDFMSASDCKLMFNVCDPVMCPATRCNLGGKFQVDDVVQSGIVGSLFLCLPNIKEGIVVPVCLTGVQAGVDNYVSIMKASRDCLQQSLDTGEYVGICDELTAIYTCEFFWRQGVPLLKVILPKLLEVFAGGTARGGGEYLNVQAAWGNMQSSVNYFTNVYSVNAMNAFKIRSTEEAGSAVCKSFVSLNFPNKFKNLIEPDSPAQFSAWFDEIPMTTATVPAKSQYKVYYHIYAGKDQGAYYSIYLKNKPGESYYTSVNEYIIATGFVGKGEYADEALDREAPSGFKELCVRINYQEICGFKQVSTSFAINYLRDAYVKEQMTNTQINSEKECISGSSSVLGMINPNIQSGVQETAVPAIYQRGIIRICATNNPGGSTDPTRWVDVGSCGDSKITCWVDKNSEIEAFTEGNIGMRNATLSELDAWAKTYANKDFALLDDNTEKEKFGEAEAKIKDMKAKGLNRIADMENDKTVALAMLDAIERNYNLKDFQNARLWFDRAWINDEMAKVKYSEIIADRSTQISKGVEEGTIIPPTPTETPATPIISEVAGKIKEQMNQIDLNLPDATRENEIKIRILFSKLIPQIKVNREVDKVYSDYPDKKGWQITTISGLKPESLWIIFGIHFGTNKEIMITGAGEKLAHTDNSCHYSGNCIDISSDEASDLFFNDWNIKINSFKDKYGFPIDAIVITDESGAACTGQCTGDHYHIKVDAIAMSNYINGLGTALTGSETPSSSCPVPSDNEAYYTAVLQDLITKEFPELIGTESLFKGIIEQESRWNPEAENTKSGALGIMQIRQIAYDALTDSTKGECYQKIDGCKEISKFNGWNNVKTISDDNVKANMRVGICYFKCLGTQGVYKIQNLFLQLAAYNQGPNNVKGNCPDLTSLEPSCLVESLYAEEVIEKRENYVACENTPASITNKVTLSAEQEAALRAKVAKMIMTEPSEIAKTFKVGGIILTDDYMKSLTGGPNDKIARVKTDIQGYKINGALLISSDVEGGKVNRLSYLGYTFIAPSQMDDTQVSVTSQSISEKMSSLGMNLDFAPVVDVAGSGTIYNANRIFNNNPNIVSTRSLLFISGLHKNNIKATLKHYPGYGNLSLNTDDGSVIDNVRTINDLKLKDLIPFDYAKGSTDAIMMNSIVYSKIDANVPAVLSDTLVGMARENFNGVIITDDLNPLINTKKFGSCGNVAVNAVQAGNDILLTNNPAKVECLINGLVAGVKGGTISESKIDESIARIEVLAS
jgi:beta-N-acetylhexosaminidase